MEEARPLSSDKSKTLRVLTPLNHMEQSAKNKQRLSAPDPIPSTPILELSILGRSVLRTTSRQNANTSYPSRNMPWRESPRMLLRPSSTVHREKENFDGPHNRKAWHTALYVHLTLEESLSPCIKKRPTIIKVSQYFLYNL